MSTTDVTTPGTEPENPVAGGESAETTSEPVGDSVPREKYDALLQRINDEREAAKRDAVAEIRTEMDQLRAMIGQGVGTNAPPANPPADQDEMTQFWFGLHQTAKFSPNPQERAAAKVLLGLIEQQNQMPRQIQEAATLAQLQPDLRTEAQTLQKELAARGEGISAETARMIVELRRQAKTQAAPTPKPPPPGTAIRPVPVQSAPSETMSMDEFDAAWRNAKTAEERDRLYKLERAGKVRRD